MYTLNYKIFSGIALFLFFGGIRAAALEGWCPGSNPVSEVTIGSQTLAVEVAANRTARRCGLSGRTELEPGTGMLFAFDKPARLTFWMRDTLVPLSVAFIDDTRRIVAILDMPDPGSETRYRSPAPARYALEAPLGWFQKAGIKPGMRCEFEIPGQRRRRGPGQEWIVPAAN